MNIPQFSTGDILVMKKPHPCKSNRFRVERTGSDIRLVCLGCGHNINVKREKIEKNIKEVIKDDK